LYAKASAFYLDFPDFSLAGVCAGGYDLGQLSRLARTITI
jgi:hypothetical protein